MSRLVYDLVLSNRNDEELIIDDANLQFPKFLGDKMDNVVKKKPPTTDINNKGIASQLQVAMHQTYAQQKIFIRKDLVSNAMKESCIELEHNKSASILDHKQPTAAMSDLPDNICDPIERLEKFRKDELINQCLLN